MGWLAATAEFLEDRSTEVAYEELIAHPEIDINFSPNPDRSSLYARRWNASQSAAIRLHVDILLNERDRSAALAPWGSRIAVAYGEFDDAWPIAEQQEMAQACGARVIMIPNAGHCPNEDQPAYTSQALVSFWDEISQ
jgi:pimeloyl-ACP methyl ester carboxylesterase